MKYRTEQNSMLDFQIVGHCLFWYILQMKFPTKNLKKKKLAKTDNFPSLRNSNHT
jgi:hypothetical protein